MRYTKNPYDELLKVYFDNCKNAETKQIGTTELLIRFVWQKNGTLNLAKGEHTLVLENSYGFNIKQNGYNSNAR